ncbi:MAG: HAMP domain-containing sensor histidine kinase [Luteolibacter sp.]
MIPRHPSLRTSLVLASSLLAALVLVYSKASLYQEIERSSRQDLDEQLLHAASLLTKSSELVPRGVIYEWQEALNSGVGPKVAGMFQFQDLTNGRVATSPDLGDQRLENQPGALDQPVYADATLANGSHVRTVSLKHLPFVNDYGKRAMAQEGIVRQPSDLPQVVTYAMGTADLEAKLTATRHRLLISTVLTLLAIWATIHLVTAWLMRPLQKLVNTLLTHSSESGAPLPEVPDRLPRELVPLVTAFRTLLGRVEVSRKHEKDFAYGAAHQLRTPVAGLLAVLEQAVARERTSEDLSRRVTQAVEITDGIRGTLDTLMRIARLKTIQTNAPFVRYDAVAIVKKAAGEEIGRSAKGHTLDWDAPDSAWMNGDDELFRVLVTILLENAVRYSPEGSPLIVRIREEDARLTLEIENVSTEEPGDDPERLFQPFQRGTRTSVNTPGAGLGLALAKEAAQAMEGQVALEVNPPDRVICRVVLPR